MLLFCNFIVASCNISFVMLIRIALLWEDLSASVFINGQGQFFWVEFSMGRYKSVGLEEGTPYRLWFS